ncbi:MAG: hypothetical protein ISR98_01820 [Parcubacteria group bacterium]|nr:hypothetical protein [Parcubacteria group bacterium]
MDQNIPTSFIPKKSLAVSSNLKSPNDGQKSIGIIFLISLIIFVGMIVLSIALFLYQQFLIQNLERKSDSLDRARAAFEPAIIQEIERLDSRMRSANQILSEHKAVSSFFSLLEANTLVSMQFENLNYETDEMGQAKVTMKGKAPSFSSVALQSDIFGENKFIHDPIFSNLNLDREGFIGFDFTATIDPRLTLYENLILGN